jgi:hypothetical protein
MNMITLEDAIRDAMTEPTRDELPTVETIAAAVRAWAEAQSTPTAWNEWSDVEHCQDWPGTCGLHNNYCDYHLAFRDGCDVTLVRLFRRDT